MRRRRQGAVLAAVALCFGGALTACGSGGGDDGYAAVGAAGSGPGAAPTAAVPPRGTVLLVPLDGAPAAGTERPEEPRTEGTGGAPGVASSSPGGTNRTGSTGESPPAGPGPAPGTAPAGTPSAPAPGPGPGPVPVPGPTPSSTAPPAVLTVGAPIRTALDVRWCEQVTVELRNIGGSPMTSGTLTFATHIIDLLGVDWATIESDRPLPTPIPAGAARTPSYTVCVDSWRVPLGMHIETQDVTAVWK